MPDRLIFVRHGHSEGNLASARSKAGDNSLFTNAFRERPGMNWRLTSEGREQAEITGRWIREHIGANFDAYYVSPYVRTRETAALLGLPNAEWRVSQLLRERDYGDIGSMSKDEIKELYPLNALTRAIDALYWRPENGESIADVRGNRVRELFDTLHREQSGKSVIVVTHGEFMSAARAELEYLSDEQWVAAKNDENRDIHNTQVMEFTRIDPKTGEQGKYLGWTRASTPWKKGFEMGSWKPITRMRFSNEELLEQVQKIEPMYLSDQD